MPFLGRFSNSLLATGKNYNRTPAYDPAPATFFVGTMGTDVVKENVIYDMTDDSSGNMYMCGTNNSSSSIVVKLNSSGGIAWQKKLTTSTLYSIRLDNNRNVYVTGSSTNSGTTQILLIKYNSSGTLQWKKNIIGTSGTTSGRSIDVDSVGNIYLLGSTSLNTSNLFVAKLNSSGAIQYQFQIGGTSSTENPYSIKLNNSGKFHICGYSTIDSISGPLIIQYNTDGTLQWQKRLSGETQFSQNRMTVDVNGNVYVVHGVSGPFNTSFQANVSSTLLTKFNSSGVFQWQKQLTDNSQKRLAPFSVDTDSLGNIYVLTSRYNLRFSDQRPNIFKFDSSGAIVWKGAYYTPGDFGAHPNDIPISLAIDSSDNIFSVISRATIATIFARFAKEGGAFVGDGVLRNFVGGLNIYTDTYTGVTLSSGEATDSSSSTLANETTTFTISDSSETESNETLTTAVSTY